MGAAPAMTVIIPCRDAASTLEPCLRSILEQTYTDFDILVIDDGSTDESNEIAARLGVQVARNPRRGVSAARNYGAQIARGGWLVFTDTDVIWPPETLMTLARFIERSPRDAYIGVHTKDLAHRNFASRFKNHWMRYTYQRLHEQEGVALFYTTFAAIRRSVFLRAGGFLERYTRPTIEDTVFGHCLGQERRTVLVRKELEVEHRKRYSLWSMLRTDYQRSRDLATFTRARGIFRLFRRNQTSVPTSHLWAVAWSAVILLGLVGLIMPPVGGPILGVGLFGFFWSQRGLLGYLRREEGIGFALVSLPVLLLDIIFVNVGILAGVLGGDGLLPQLTRHMLE